MISTQQNLPATPSERSFDTEPPRCPLRQCDMRSNHQVVGRGWDFEYQTTHIEIDMLQCDSCRLIFPREIPAESALQTIYPPNYYSFAETKYPNRLVMAIRGWVAQKKARGYMAMVNSATAHVLDIGCGDGRLLDELKASCPSGWQFYGIDWSEHAIKCIRRKGYDGRSGDIGRMDLPDWQGKFDLVLMHQLIEHVRDPRETLIKVRRLLKDGGVVSIETPDINAWDFSLLKNRYWSVYHIPRHFYIFNKRNFTELAREVGFEVISTVSLINPVAWIHSIKSYCADKVGLRRLAGFFHHQNVLMLAVFTPLELIQTRIGRRSSNMQINLRKTDGC